MLTLLLMPFFTYAEPSKTVQKLGPVEVGKAFPVFGGLTSTSEYFSFQKNIGKSHLTVVSYFTIWSAPCRKILPAIEGFIRSNKNVQGIYIVLDTEPDKVNPFAKELELKTPILVDKFEFIAQKHGIVSKDGRPPLPKTFLVDTHGKVIDIVVIEGDDFVSLLESHLK